MNFLFFPKLLLTRTVLRVIIQLVQCDTVNTACAQAVFLAQTSTGKRGSAMITLDYADKRPIYEQVKEKFKELIISGILKEHDKIPSVRELASHLAINPNTIQKAYHELEKEDYIYSVAAKGNYVSPRENTAKSENSKVSQLYEELAACCAELCFLGEDKESVIKLISELFDKEVSKND